MPRKKLREPKSLTGNSFCISPTNLVINCGCVPMIIISSTYINLKTLMLPVIKINKEVSTRDGVKPISSK
jgi:hypothetical protein